MLASSVSEACQSFLASIDIISLPIYYIYCSSLHLCLLPVLPAHSYFAPIVIGLLTSKKRPVDFSRGHDDAAFSTANVFLFLFVSTSRPFNYTATDKRERKAWLACIPTYLVHTYLHTHYHLSTTYLHAYSEFIVMHHTVLTLTGKCHCQSSV